jgi:hypothetical protein
MSDLKLHPQNQGVEHDLSHLLNHQLTMTVTTASASADNLSFSSPTSVVADTPKHHVESMQLPSAKRYEKELPTSWVCPASAKSVRTRNPIRAIVDPIVANVKLGHEREDGKDPISLAVS